MIIAQLGRSKDVITKGFILWVYLKMLAQLCIVSPISHILKVTYLYWVYLRMLDPLVIYKEELSHKMLGLTYLRYGIDNLTSYFRMNNDK